MADELRVRCGDEGWSAVSENLHLALSLRNLQADTDLTGHSYLCSSAVDYDEALSALWERHLAGIVVFHLCWSAYEGVVEIAAGGTQGRRPKGALRRDLLRAHQGDAHFPWLRQCLLASLTSASPGGFAERETRAMIAEGALAAVAAELLRSFRNDVAHGTLARPQPEDWGNQSAYDIDADPAIRRFHHHLRRLLLLIQLMMLQTNAVSTELSQVADGWAATTEVLTQLHCGTGADDDHQEMPELDLGVPRLSFDRC